jgi:glycosyltransferase involved in cell wall biosynthesis
LPLYPDQELALPPLLEILRWADEQQFDVVHVDSPGPMGLAGWIVAKMLHVPMLATYHTDFPAYIRDYTGDHRLSVVTESYMRWFHGQAATIFTRSRAYESNLRQMGLREQGIVMIPPGVNTEKFNHRHRDENLWQRLGVKEPRRLLYVGRIAVEKNLAMLCRVFRSLCATRKDTALVIAGGGPFMSRMKEELADLPAYFLGCQNDAQLSPLYSSADLFVFPSRTDTLGQVVLEAQSSGLPVLVSDEGGPREMMDDGVTGRVLPATDETCWVNQIGALLDDEPLRHRMSRSAAMRAGRFSLAKTFSGFWEEHVKAVNGQGERRDPMPPVPAQPEPVGSY